MPIVRRTGLKINTACGGSWFCWLWSCVERGR